jgi:hypothetical protein
VIDAALDCVERGWYIFPCVPGRKMPFKGSHGVLDATLCPEQIRAWWAKTPDADVAIACGPSGLAVLDCDHGNMTEADYRGWAAWLPETYTVRTGRRTSFGTQSYFQGTVATGGWAIGAHRGELRSLGALVIAAGGAHKSGARYEVLIDAPVAPLPEHIAALVKAKRATKTEEIADTVALSHRDWLLAYLDHYAVATRTDAIRITGGWKIGVHCPLTENDPMPHGEDSTTGTVVQIINGWLSFVCSHNTCQGRNTKAFKKEMYRRAGAYRRDPGDIIVKL